MCRQQTRFSNVCRLRIIKMRTERGRPGTEATLPPSLSHYVYLPPSLSLRVSPSLSLTTCISLPLSHYVYLPPSLSRRVSPSLSLTTCISLPLSHNVYFPLSHPLRLGNGTFCMGYNMHGTWSSTLWSSHSVSPHLSSHQLVRKCLD